MAFTGSPTGTTQFNQQTGVTSGGVYGGDSAGQLHATIFDYTHTSTAGAGTGEVNIITLPPGSIAVLPNLCAFGVSVAWAAGSTVSFGNRAFTLTTGATQALSATSLTTAIAIGAATKATTAFDTPTFGSMLRLNSMSGVVIHATIAGGNITVGGTLAGYIVWADPT